jgi:hypothetical protein
VLLTAAVRVSRGANAADITYAIGLLPTNQYNNTINETVFVDPSGTQLGVYGESHPGSPGTLIFDNSFDNYEGFGTGVAYFPVAPSPITLDFTFSVPRDATFTPTVGVVRDCYCIYNGYHGTVAGHLLDGTMVLGSDLDGSQSFALDRGTTYTLELSGTVPPADSRTPYGQYLFTAQTFCTGPAIPAVPLPASWLMFGAALLGLTALGARGRPAL